MKQKIVVISGPTCTGKTNVSVELAKKIDGEIISADSMQVYRYMDIGTAKICTSEMHGVPHYMIDIVDPDCDFSVALYKTMAKKAMSDIILRGKIPIIVGGTGFYIAALIMDNDFDDYIADVELQKKLEEEVKSLGKMHLHEKLQALDNESAMKIHPNNIKKVIHALEYFYTTGKTISEHNSFEQKRESIYDVDYFVLSLERIKLYHRIETRVDSMISNGLIDEVKFLLSKGYGASQTSMQGIGYKEIIEYLNGITTLEEAVEKIKLATRHYAKRQMTWFRHKTNAVPIDVLNYKNSELTNYIAQKCFNK